MNTARFGEKIELPPQYGSFWQEYQEALSKEKLDDCHKDYFTRRISFVLPDAGLVKEGNKERIILTAVPELPAIPVIYDTYTYHWNGDDVYGEATIPESEDKETIISLRPEIETVLFQEEILRYRKISPQLEFIDNCWNNCQVGNPKLVGILLDIFEDSYIEKGKEGGNLLHQGNALKSIPHHYPLEKEIAELYEKIGRKKFDETAQEYCKMQKVLRDAKVIDSASVSGLEETINSRYRVMRSDLLSKL